MVQPHDPVLLGKISHGHPPATGQPVLGGHQQHGGIGEQLGQVELGRVEALPLVVPQQRQVHGAVLQPLDELGLPLAANLQPDGRVQLAEPVHRQRQERAGYGGERAQRQPALAQPGDLGQVRLGRRQPAEHYAGVRREHQAGVGRRHPAGVPAQQRLTHLALQPTQLLRHRRRGVDQRVRRGRHRPQLHDRQQHLQPLDVQHRSSALD